MGGYDFLFFTPAFHNHFGGYTEGMKEKNN